MKYTQVSRQVAIPLQRILQPHANGRYQDQSKQGGECQAAYHRNGKWRPDRTGIFSVAHCQREHRHDSCNRRNQDRTDARQACRHQGPVATEALLAEYIGVIDQDDAVVHYYAQQDEEAGKRIGIQQAVAGKQQGKQRADSRQRNGEKQYKRRYHRLEDGGQDHKDKHKGGKDKEFEVGKLIFFVEDLYRHACRQVVARD